MLLVGEHIYRIEQEKKVHECDRLQKLKPKYRNNPDNRNTNTNDCDNVYDGVSNDGVNAPVYIMNVSIILGPRLT